MKPKRPIPAWESAFSKIHYPAEISLKHPVPVHFENFHILEILAVDDKTHHRDLLVKTCLACRPRIDVEQVEFRVVHHL